jgi:hypothetical protein
VTSERRSAGHCGLAAQEQKGLLAFLRDRRGATAALFAVMLTALLGMAGLGVDVGIWYTLKRQYQSAADAAALSGAMELAAGRGQADIRRLAKYAATHNMTSDAASALTVATGCITPSVNQICVNNPPQFSPPSLPCYQNSYCVEAILAESGPSIFPRIVGYDSPIIIRTRAVAGFHNIPTCMLALDPLGTDLSFGGGNGNLNAPNCAFMSDSIDPAQSILLNGNVTMNIGAIDTAGGYTLNGGGSGTISPLIATNVLSVTNPYDSVTINPLTGSIPTTCATTGTFGSGVTQTISPTVKYCGGLIFQSGSNITLQPGIYYIDGGTMVGNNFTGLEIDPGATVNGSGVTFVLTSINPAYGNKAGSIQITGGSGSLAPPGANSGLLQPSAAASAGLLIFQDPNTSPNSDPNTITTGGWPCSSSLSLTGAVVTKYTQDALQGNQTAACSTCTDFIASSFTFSGTLYLDASGCSSVGAETALVPGPVLLAE